jgi:DNA-binding MarR family transcriptional regulator
MATRNPEIDIQALQLDGRNCLVRLMLPLYRAFNALAQEQYAARGYAGLTPAHTLLFASLDTTGTRIVTLAERMGTSKQFTGRLVHQLAEAGYMTTEPDPSDRRATIVRATPKGLQFFADACAVKNEIEAMFAAVAGEADYAVVVATLAKLAAAFSAQGKAGSLHPLGEDS